MSNNSSRNKKFQLAALICVVSLVVGIAYWHAQSSGAFTAVASSEAEQGTVSGSAVALSDVSASGNAAVRFSHSSGPTDLPGWKLDNVEDFNSINTSTWTVLDAYHMGGHAEVDKTANVTIDNGALRLQAKKETGTASDGTTENYTSGMIWSKGKYTLPNYYRIETRVKIPWGQGMWPGLVWSRPDDLSDGEIDYYESIGRELAGNRLTGVVHQTIHSGGYGATHVQDGTALTINNPEDWHTVVFEKTKDSMVWKVDGVVTKRITSASAAWNTAAFETPTKRWFVWINLQLGGSWAGSPDATTDFTPNKSAALVDYIYTWTPSS